MRLGMCNGASTATIGFRSHRGEELPVTYMNYVSPENALLDLVWTSRSEKEELSRRPPGMWRYREALPLSDEATPVSFGEGFTPLLPVTIHSRTVLVKQE